MGQGQSSAGLGSADHPTGSHDTAPGASPDLLTDRVRQCLRADDVTMGTSESAMASLFITGSFNQWSGKIPMQRSTKDFTVILELPPGIIEYKFIVDDQWRYAPDQPTVRDVQSVINNQMEIRASSQTESALNYFDDQDTIHDYDQVEPSPDVYSKDPPQLPPHLGIILLNSEEIAGQNDAVMLPVPQHVTLNHMYISKSEAKEVCVLGMTQRYNNKFVTTVYYRPGPVIGPDGHLQTNFFH